MNKKTIIGIAAFGIPAILAYYYYDYAETLNRVAYAIAIGLAFCLPIGAIVEGADPEYRKKATVEDKINLLLQIVAFPIIYLLLNDYYSRIENYPGRAVIAWSSFLFGFGITYCIGKAITFVVKLFGKE